MLLLFFYFHITVNIAKITVKFKRASHNIQVNFSSNRSNQQITRARKFEFKFHPAIAEFPHDELLLSCVSKKFSIFSKRFVATPAYSSHSRNSCVANTSQLSVFDVSPKILSSSKMVTQQIQAVAY